MEEKARLLRQKNELNNLMKTVENNIEPKRFKSAVGRNGTTSDSHIDLQDFDSSFITSKLGKSTEKSPASAAADKTT